MKFTKLNQVPISWSIKGNDASIPSLTMLINPSSLETQYNSLISETRTLGGFVHEYWGEQLTSLSASGSTAMFVNDFGLTNESRTTEAYQYFISLLNIYKNNGKSYYKTYITNASLRNPNRITDLSFVSMIFDGKEFQGRFESFDYAETAGKPFTLDYNFSFKVFNIVGQLTL